MRLKFILMPANALGNVLPFKGAIMPSLIEVRQAAIAKLKQGLPHLKIEPFLADVSLASLSRQSLNSTTIFVAVLEAHNIAQNSLDFNILGNFAAFCLVRQKSTHMREDQALALAQNLSWLIHAQTFGLEQLGPAKILQLAPLSEASLEAKGINIWSVLWQQALVFTKTQPLTQKPWTPQD